LEQKERILRICDEVREISKSEENTAIMERWRPSGEDVSVTQGSSVWHGVPYVPLTGNSIVPYTIDPELSVWGTIIGFDPARYYQEPLYYLENHLKIKIERYRMFKDDSYVSTAVPIFIGVDLEPSMFGVKSIYMPGKDPALDSHDPVVCTKEDIDNLEMPDFYNSGIMPKVHRYYQQISEILPDDFSVIFPTWGRGPWGNAQHIMGFENLMTATIENPSMIHRLMEFLVKCQTKWLSDRAEFLGIPVGAGVMYNDEVNCQLYSSEVYEKFIYPYETLVTNNQNGITYWHSCGNASPIIRFVKQLKGLRLFDVSPWTDWETAAKQLRDTSIALEVRMHPTKDVLLADEAAIRAKIARVREVFTGFPVTVRADGLGMLSSIDKDLPKMLRWCSIADEMLHPANN